jgi:hypothetical protein
MGCVPVEIRSCQGGPPAGIRTSQDSRATAEIRDCPHCPPAEFRAGLRCTSVDSQARKRGLIADFPVDEWPGGADQDLVLTHGF